MVRKNETPTVAYLEKRWVYLSPEDWAKIDELAGANGIKAAIQIRMILHRALEVMDA